MTIEPTVRFFMAGDVMVRLWEGRDTEGQPVLALVAAVACAGQDLSAPEGLRWIPPPSMDDARRWAATVMRQAGTSDGDGAD